jgi:SAM-dependent methyltransferase
VPGRADSGAPLEPQVGELADATWALAAFSVALDQGLVQALAAGGDAGAIAQRTRLPAPLAARLLDVLGALGLATWDEAAQAFAATPALAPLIDDPGLGARLGAQARSALLQAADLGARAREGTLDLEGWRHEDPEILQLQGVSSSGAVPALASAFPSLGDLGERMQRPGAAALDVGTGVAAIAIALAQRFEHLRVVGLEPARAPLGEARRNVVAAGLEQRIELRAQRVEDLADESAFDFVFMPTAYLSAAALRRGLAAVERALRPGGWVVLGALGAPDGALAPAVERLRATLWGSEALAPEAVAALCEEAGLIDVRVLDAPAEADLVPIAARRAAHG